MKKIQEYINQGYISTNKHPYLPLTIYSYTHQAMFDWFWPKEIRKCRGLVLDNKENIIANPFPKFFNYHELSSLGLSTPKNEQYDIFEKLDGSLIIITKYFDNVVIASRGSFDSDQAKKASQIFQNKFDPNLIEQNLTYCFEVIYPENRELTPLVVNYEEDQNLYLLSVRETQSGKELPIQKRNFPTPRTFPSESLEQLLKHDRQNEEGYVIKFRPSNFRVKIKFDNYIIRHRVLSQLSEKVIWEMLKDHDDVQHFIETAPDHIAKWVNEVSSNLIAQFQTMEKEVESRYQSTVQILDEMIGDWDRRDFAQFVQEHHPKNEHLLYKKLDDRSYEELMWKKLKP